MERRTRWGWRLVRRCDSLALPMAALVTALMTAVITAPMVAPMACDNWLGDPCTDTE